MRYVKRYRATLAAKLIEEKLKPSPSLAPPDKMRGSQSEI
jgi:hypothetical protein